MTVQLLSPEGMIQPVPYAHVSVATGSRHVHIAGQVGRDPDTDHMADDLAGQVAQALRNTARGLAGAGATFADVVRLRFFVTQWSPEKMGDFMAGVELVARELGLPQPMPPASLIGVEILFEADVLVELEAYAVLD
ncbi:RidA family protein [Cryobacterium sp. TMT1-3]|uniref:RidA family protein n=1 Tax=Cryobacterium luteum TaxID=1424661 RepID=A0A1H8F4K9_9MICO|nr:MULTISPECIES: RidA family protein [Cryobacterium]TFB85509.1 RidA family protein [Cryobacterium luteum]TFC26586.1 RidA family protein [Cryobacterium sp. TMT1-3]SEN26639.1 Enamine deaminase RidA, house cleaning of reactive enamine intermediates, YjgF/YER057c/UK114 family [Cryobacterium luteum]